MAVREGSRAERLVTEDSNWSEVPSEKAAPKKGKGGQGGSSDNSGRRSRPRGNS